MPEVQAVVLREMLRVLEQAGVDAVALARTARRRGRSRSCSAPGRPPMPSTPCCTRAVAGCRDVLGTLRTAVIDEATWTALGPDRRTLFDVDEPGDLTR